MDDVLMNRFAQCHAPSQRGNLSVLPFPEEYLHLLMPFVPEYGLRRMGGRTLDFSVEREWRARGDFNFTRDQLAAIIVPTEDDINPFVNENPMCHNLNFIVAEELHHTEIKHWDFNHFFRQI